MISPPVYRAIEPSRLAEVDLRPVDDPVPPPSHHGFEPVPASVPRSLPASISSVKDSPWLDFHRRILIRSSPDGVMVNAVPTTTRGLHVDRLDAPVQLHHAAQPPSQQQSRHSTSRAAVVSGPSSRTPTSLASLASPTTTRITQTQIIYQQAQLRITTRPLPWDTIWPVARLGRGVDGEHARAGIGRRTGFRALADQLPARRAGAGSAAAPGSRPRPPPAAPTRRLDVSGRAIERPGKGGRRALGPASRSPMRRAWRNSA